MSVSITPERALAQLLISALNLEELDAGGIDPEAPLFGSEPGSLGLDSIDALEIVLAIQQEYGVELRAADESNRQVFRSLRALSAHVQSLVAG
ncbi:phosphopantetheine-binding protein [Panacagrimonas sp.]|uniref:phosphopantetheine-binding protein n=1 Tax=Panacagrimonas sp. TaxID=2480088 RepID=UPI003B52EC18